MKDEVDGTKIYAPPTVKADFDKITASYNSLEAKQKYWSSSKLLDYRRIEKVDDFYNFYRLYSNRGYIPYIFRGVNEAKFKIFTSLQVAYLNKELKNYPYKKRTQFVQLELDHAKDMKCKYCRRNQLPCGLEDIDFIYLSFLQHFGLYTPILDFSFNLDKALFFAQDNMQQPSKPEHDIDEYVSLYWLQPEETKVKNQSTVTQYLYAAGVRPQNELINIVDFYQNNLVNVIPWLAKAMPTYKDVDTRNIEPRNFYSWCNDATNRGFGLHNLELGYLAETKTVYTKSIRSFRELVDWLEMLKPKMADGSVSENEMNDYLEALQNSLVYNVRLANINMKAQEGCFILFNPQEKEISLEDYWKNNHICTNLPHLHCVDIKKDIIIQYVRPLLEQKNINTTTIYPTGSDAVKQDLKVYLNYLKELGDN